MGTGYVGLVSGAGLSDFGNHVTCVDIDEPKVRSLQQGVIPIFEPGLKEIVDRNVQKKRLTFSTDVDESIRNADVVFIAVGTPAGQNGDADLSVVFDVALRIAKNLNGYKVVVTKSTVPVHTGRKIKELIEEHRGEPNGFDIVSNPEFLREGSAVDDFMHPDRVVIGTSSDRAREIMRSVYRPLYLNETPMVLTDIETAELIKYAANAFLAVKISYINEIANVAENVGADVKVVAKAMGLDGRISSKFLHAGGGYGGSCFPKDTRALVRIADAAGVKSEIVAASIRVNDRQKQLMFEKIRSLLPALKGKTVGILGLSFKPNTDDVREATAFVIIDRLLKSGAVVRAYDPAAMEQAKKAYPHLTYCRDAYEAAEGADCLVIVTEWNEFRELDFDRLKKTLKAPNLVDCRNIYDPARIRALGFGYRGVGRGVNE